MKKKLFLGMSALLISFSMSAIDIYVNPTTGNDANNGTMATPLKTIEAAVFKVTDNNPTTIHLSKNSVFMLGAVLNFGENKKVDIIGQNSTLKAAELPGQKDPSGLPLTGQGNRILRAVTNCDLKIKGVTFQNGRQVGYILGGGIYFAGNTLEIDSCRFIDNQAGSAGGAVGCRAKSVIIKNSYFQGNNILGGGARGAAIMQCGQALVPGTLVVQNCTFYQNMTQVGGSGMVINIFDSTDSSVGGKYSNVSSIQVTNCTFLENTSPTAYQAAIDVSDSDCGVALTNNTFYNNTDGAFRLLLSKAYLANNVIVGGKQGILSEAKVADGRPEMVAVNNIVIGTEGGVNGGIDDACFTSAAAANNNVVSKIASYPVAALGLATSLSTDNFVPYLPTSANSTLIDAGTDNTLAKFGTNYVLNVDVRGRLTNNKKDIGAYEYSGILNAVFTPEYVSDNYRIAQSQNTFTVKSLSDKSFTLSIVNTTGRVVYSTRVSGSVELSKNKFGQGIYILVFNDGSKTGSQKVVF